MNLNCCVVAMFSFQGRTFCFDASASGGELSEICIILEPAVALIVIVHSWTKIWVCLRIIERLVVIVILKPKNVLSNLS